MPSNTTPSLIPDDVDSILSDLARETLTDVLESPPPPPPPSQYSSDTDETSIATATNTLLKQMIANERFVNEIMPRLLSNSQVADVIPQLLNSPFILQSLQIAFRDPALLSAAVDPMFNNLDHLLPLLTPLLSSPKIAHPHPESLD